MVAITGIIILVPYLEVRSLQLTFKIGNLQISSTGASSPSELQRLDNITRYYRLVKVACPIDVHLSINVVCMRTEELLVLTLEFATSKMIKDN